MLGEVPATTEVTNPVYIDETHEHPLPIQNQGDIFIVYNYINVKIYCHILLLFIYNN